MPDNLGTVFISYTHESPAHAQAVLDLSNRLRSHGIDCVLDQYESSPHEGWPKWMDREIKQAEYVIMICTETYHRRVTHEEKPGIGLGVAWEGQLIYNHIYNAASDNTKFIPVILDPTHASYIPTPIQGATRYCLSSSDGYQQLYSRLIGRPPAKKPPLGQREALPPREVKTTFFSPSGYGIRIVLGTGAPYHTYEQHLHERTHLISIGVVNEFTTQQLTNCEITLVEISGAFSSRCPVPIKSGFTLNPGASTYIKLVELREPRSGPPFSAPGAGIRAYFPINPLPSDKSSWLDHPPYTLTLMATAAESPPHRLESRLLLDDRVLKLEMTSP